MAVGLGKDHDLASRDHDRASFDYNPVGGNMIWLA